MPSRSLRTTLLIALAAGTMASALAVSAAEAGAVRGGVVAGGSALASGDDNSSGPVGLGFTMNYFGSSQTELYVNNNGNVTFGSANRAFTASDLSGATDRPIIAPFFADVDTRPSGANGQVSYGSGSVGGRDAFAVTWDGVGYYNSMTDKQNSFQLVIIDRSDTGAGNVDLEFNYDQIQWEAGSASGGVDGLGGDTARAGWSAGSGLAGTFAELLGSGEAGAFLDGACGADGNVALACNSLNSDVLGRYVFELRNGDVQSVALQESTVAAGSGGGVNFAGSNTSDFAVVVNIDQQVSVASVPEPMTVALFGAGLLGLGALRYRARRR